MNTTADTTTHATGPTTADGKRIAARNATTHGLFARDVVLPHLGEDPQGYEALLQEFTAKLKPQNLLERHYTEKIAAASWRLRRLHRWQAQLLEDPELTEDEVLARLDRVMRHETTLHRQIDTSVKMLARDLPQLFESRARKEALDEMGATEDYCRRNPSTDLLVEARARERLSLPTTPPSLDPTTLDNTRPEPQICQNEPAPATLPDPPVAGGPCERSEPGGGPDFCQNEPWSAPLRRNNIAFPRPGGAYLPDAATFPSVPCPIARRKQS